MVVLGAGKDVLGGSMGEDASAIFTIGPGNDDHGAGIFIIPPGMVNHGHTMVNLRASKDILRAGIDEDAPGSSPRTPGPPERRPERPRNAPTPALATPITIFQPPSRSSPFPLSGGKGEGVVDACECLVHRA